MLVERWENEGGSGADIDSGGLTSCNFQRVEPPSAWALTPAYDLTFVKGRGFTAKHQMRVQDKTSGVTMDDVLAVADIFDIRAALDRREEFATVFDVAADRTRAILAEVDERAREMGGSV